MSKIYCPECGKANDYVSEKPNFCMNCGFSFNSKLKAKKQSFSEESTEGDEDEITELNVDPDFELDVEISTQNVQGYKIQDIVGTSEGYSPDRSQQKRGRGRPKKVKNEDVWRDFKDEAGGSPRKENP